jgi:hypothetical protein
MKRLLDADDPFFAPVWRRWATFLLPTAWGLAEFWFQEPFWGVLFVGSGLYAGYVLIVKGPSGT